MTANASTDHQFLGWDGPSISISISKNPLELDVDSDKQVKVNFLNGNYPNYSGIDFYADSLIKKQLKSWIINSNLGIPYIWKMSTV